jgi:hypothetical protein
MAVRTVAPSLPLAREMDEMKLVFDREVSSTPDKATRRPLALRDA